MKRKERDEIEKEIIAEDNGIFQTSNEKKMLNQPKVNILGKIDLSSINQSTRPKKKDEKKNAEKSVKISLCKMHRARRSVFV